MVVFWQVAVLAGMIDPRRAFVEPCAFCLAHRAAKMREAAQALEHRTQAAEGRFPIPVPNSIVARP